jgi:hypothetical protein
MSAPNNVPPNIPDSGGRGSGLIVLIVVGLGIFALIVGWNGILNPPPKPTSEQLRQAEDQRRQVERQLMEAVRQVEPQEAPVTHTTPRSAIPFSVSDGDAKQKYERATQLPPNWATQECVDIIVRYPDSPEATLAADMLIDKSDHILYRDFLTLTGERLPVDYDLPRDQVIAILRASFEKRGIRPAK